MPLNYGELFPAISVAGCYVHAGLLYHLLVEWRASVCSVQPWQHLLDVLRQRSRPELQLRVSGAALCRYIH